MSEKGHLSKGQKFQVLWEACTRAIPTLMARCRISQATAYRYADAMRTLGYLERKEGSGGQNKIPEGIQKKVVHKLNRPEKPISIHAVANGLGISDQSVRTIAKGNGMAWRKLKRRALSAKQRSLRNKFCRQMLLRISDISYIVWTDETSFWLNKASPSYAWVKIGSEDEYEPRADLVSKKVNVWGAICANGVISLSLFEENLTASLYEKILRAKIGEMKALNPEGFIFMCDNDPKHTADKSVKFISHTFMDYLKWPSYSPDINPMENTWAWLKRRVSKDMPSNINSLKGSIRKHWRELTTEMIIPYVNDMERRFREIIKHQDRRINV